MVHRDVKMDNVMLMATDASSAVKLIDFGLSAIILPLDEMRTRLFTDSPGSRHYRAAEMLDWKHTHRIGAQMKRVHGGADAMY